MYLQNFQELVIAIEHPKGVMQEAPYTFFNTKKKEPGKSHIKPLWGMDATSFGMNTPYNSQGFILLYFWIDSSSPNMT